VNGLHAFMGYGNVEGGEACTFTCPPGHRIVGYGGSTLLEEDSDANSVVHEAGGGVAAGDGDEDRSAKLVPAYIGRIRFVTACFSGPS
jgi:hypothetical protein